MGRIYGLAGCSDVPARLRLGFEGLRLTKIQSLGREPKPAQSRGLSPTRPRLFAANRQLKTTVALGSIITIYLVNVRLSVRHVLSIITQKQNVPTFFVITSLFYFHFFVIVVQVLQLNERRWRRLTEQKIVS